MGSLNKSLITGTIWSGGGQVLAMVITLGTNIILARMLSPVEFGQVGIIMFFIILSNVFSKGGLGGALVRTKNPELIDFSTVFIFNLVVSVFCYLLLVVFSGKIAEYYGDPLLRNLLIITGLVLPINAFQITQNTKMVIEMDFKRKSLFTLVAISVSSLIGLLTCALGAGVWSLVAIQLINSTITTLLYWRYIGFAGSEFKFSNRSFKKLYAFGANTTLASLLNTGFDNVYQIVLGKYFSISQVGLFYQAKKLQDVPGNVINMVTQGVFFSALSKVQDNKPLFLRKYNKIVLFFTVVMGLFTVLIYLYSKELILLLYGKKWLGAVFYMKLLTIASFFYLQEMMNRIIFKVFNETRKFLVLEILKKAIHCISIVLGIVYLNLDVLIVGYIVTNAISYLINYYFSRRILGKVSSFEIIMLLKVCFLGSFVIVCMEYGTTFIDLGPITNIYFAPIAVAFYFLLLYLLRVFNLRNEISNLKKMLKNE